MKLDKSRDIQFILGTILCIFLCATVLAIFVPANPTVPSLGLDASWMMAMNQGVAQGLVFGRDIVFTFGPYSSIYTEVYNPATDKLMLGGSFYLGLNYAVLLLLLGKGENKFKLLLYGIFLACLMDSRDALLFSYPLILSLVVYRMTLPDGHAWKLPLAKLFQYTLALFFAPFGLLVLIKGSLLPLCGIIELFCIAIFCIRKQWTIAVFAAIIPAISCCFFWSVSGGPITALPRYFLSSRQFISGYTEAMAFPGNAWECFLYVFVAILIFATILLASRGPKPSTIFLGAVFALFLFTAFKAGFVRHDAWHNITAGSSLLAAALLLPFVSKTKVSLFPVVVGLLVWIYIGHGLVHTTRDDVSLNLRTTFVRPFQGASARLSAKDDLHKSYDEHIAVIRAKFPIPQLPGTMDIYSYDQAWVLASGNTWAPRPVTQSYSAYTAELAELNLRHLEGASAPDNILFRVEPIDHRLASLEDGLSWPALINRYSLQKLEGGTAYLQKKTALVTTSPEKREEIYSARHEFERDVTLPDSSDPLFAQIGIDPTFLGKLRSALFKPPELFITLRLRDGQQVNYRVISTMMNSDFLITPLVKNTEEFVMLAAGGNKYLIGNEVKSISIIADDPHGLFWKTNYSLKLVKLNLLKNAGAENSLQFERFAQSTSGNLATPAAH